MSKISIWTGAIVAAATAGCYHAAVNTAASPSPNNTAASTASSPTPAASSTPLYVIDGTLVTAAPQSIGRAMTSAPSDATPLYVIDGVIVAPMAPAAPQP